MTDTTEQQNQESMPPIPEETSEETLVPYTKDEETKNEEEAPHREELKGNLSEAEEALVAKKPSYVLDQFWDSEKGIVETEKLNKSYNNLREQFNKGGHKAPENGEYDVSALVEKGVDTKDPLLMEFTKWAREHDVSQYAFHDLTSTFASMQKESIETGERYVAEQKAALGPKADERIASLQQWFRGLQHKNVLTENQAREASEQMAGSAFGVEVFERLQRYYGEHAAPIDTSTVDGDSSAELDEAIADPRWKTNPSYRKGVEKKFERKYGAQTANPFSHSVALFDQE